MCLSAYVFMCLGVVYWFVVLYNDLLMLYVLNNIFFLFLPGTTAVKSSFLSSNNVVTVEATMFGSKCLVGFKNFDAKQLGRLGYAFRLAAKAFEKQQPSTNDEEMDTETDDEAEIEGCNEYEAVGGDGEEAENAVERENIWPEQVECLSSEKEKLFRFVAYTENQYGEEPSKVKIINNEIGFICF